MKTKKRDREAFLKAWILFITETDPWENPLLTWAIPIKVEYYYLQLQNYLTVTGKIPNTLEELKEL